MPSQLYCLLDSFDTEASVTACLYYLQSLADKKIITGKIDIKYLGYDIHKKRRR